MERLTDTSAASFIQLGEEMHSLAEMPFEAVVRTGDRLLEHDLLREA